MRIGITLTGHDKETLDEAVAGIVKAEVDGFSSVWRPHIFGIDALTLLALAAKETSRIELGTAVVPTYPRHPHALAQQAATVQAASGGRLALGIGRSHQVVIETMFGLEYSKPIAHMRDYVTVMSSLLNEGNCSYSGKAYSVNAPLTVPGGSGVPILIGALMPKMLDLCGALCDGTLTWMCGPKYVENTVVPRLAAAAEKAGRKTPRVVVSLPVCVTDKADEVREYAGKVLVQYGHLPVYRSCLDAEGLEGPADIALIGSEEEVQAGLRRIAGAGATDFYAAVLPEGSRGPTARSDEFLRSLGGTL